MQRGLAAVQARKRYHLVTFHEVLVATTVVESLQLSPHNIKVMSLIVGWSPLERLTCQYRHSKRNHCFHSSDMVLLQQTTSLQLIHYKQYT